MTEKRKSQLGVALIAVLWLVAAMGLIITGIVQAVRVELRSAGMQRQAVVDSALADAAILLALQTMQSQAPEPGKAPQDISVQFGGQTVEVSVQPLNGLVDINNASVVLLADMYRHAGGLSSGEAQAMAQATIDARQSKNAKGATQGFDAVEDLMRVPAMTYQLYGKIKFLVTAELKSGSGRVNPMAATAGVLQILTGGDPNRASILAAGRNSDPKLMDTSFLKPELIEMTSSRSLQLQVQIDSPGGSSFQKRWQVFLDADPRSGLPWRVLGMQQLIQQSAQASH